MREIDTQRECETVLKNKQFYLRFKVNYARYQKDDKHCSKKSCAVQTDVDECIFFSDNLHLGESLKI